MASLVLNILVVVATGALAVRLFAGGLSHRYRAFFYYLIFTTLVGLVCLPLDPRQGLYQKVYVLTEPIGWIFFAWVVLELYSLVLKDYKGLYTVGRWTLLVAVALAVLGSAIIVMVPSHTAGQMSRILPYYYVTERAIYFSLVVFLLTIVAFLLQYPVTLSRNIVLHSVVYTLYFLSNTVAYLILSAGGFSLIWLTRYALQLATLAALMVWLVRLNPAGEQHSVRTRPAWMPGREEELIDQLNSLNEALLRASRK